MVRTLILTLVALCVGVGIGFYQISQESAQVGSSRLVPMAGSKIGGGFSLIGDDDTPVSDADFAGRYQLIYFGFTYCPAICPTELQKITRVLEKLSPAKAAMVQPLFITIDPQRDTPAVMHDYVALFHDRMVGLSGSVAQIEKVKKDYRIYASKVVDEASPEDYTMDHSSYIYFMSPEQTLIAIYHMQDDADKIAAQLEGFL